MALVDYSESDASGSEAEAPAWPERPTTTTTTTATRKKQPPRRAVDRSGRGGIVVDLAPPAADEPARAAGDGAPPAKRARTALFAGFNALLPPPRRAAARSPRAVGLKTSAEPGFERRRDDAPPEQRAAAEVELVGRPLVFKPLSVARSRGTARKKKTKEAAMAAAAPPSAPASAAAVPASAPAKPAPLLFSMHGEEAREPPARPTGAYEPLFEAGLRPPEPGAPPSRPPPPPPPTTAASLDSVADDLKLSAAARRDLFGRGGGGAAAAAVGRVVNFNTDQEYAHNEAVRAAGDQHVHQPVRALQGGKHSLRQLVQNVHNQRDALEDSFAKGKSNRKDASSRYGW